VSAHRAKASLKSLLVATSSIVGVVVAAPALAQEDQPSIVTIDGVTPADSLDTAVDVTGIGMFFRADGSVCSGSLVNPRMVLFAAHCVNNRPESDYGPNGVPAAWSFGADALPGFIDWINNGFASNADMAVFNVAQILYNSQSLARPEGSGFLEGDVAISVLDTPAGNIPTWALLFSALPAPTAYSQATGSGYHVDLVGYGRSGEGTFGAYNGVDFRRRAAENYIGALASLDDRNSFLFGIPAGALPQNLYQLDFDDPTRTNPFDFDLFRGDAAGNEGLTSGGDSGGPLILDAAGNAGIEEDLVIGVLSGGSRFFGAQDFSTYGTASFYQPLYLFWDWIVENNPYRYVTTTGADGNWEDPNHWVTVLDPAFRVIDANGNIVNGLPTDLGEGINDTSAPWGELCFAPVVCATLETGAVAPYSGEGAAAAGMADATSNSIGTATLDAGFVPTRLPVSEANEDYASADGGASGAEPGPASALPASTLDNGLPGATGFVADNIDATSVSAGRYFDVTLTDGTTRLSSAVEVDRFTLAGSGAGLDIAASGDLTSLIEIMHQSGSMNVDGSLTSMGDYLLMSGMLTGSGTINTPYLTSIMGLIAPGGIDEIGNLTVNGNVILASASGLLIDVAPNATDRLTVSGEISLGGTLMINPINGYVPRFGDSRTFIYAGSSSGGFNSIADLPGALRPVSSQAGGQVSFSITADPLVQQATQFTNFFQYNLAGALDGGRASYGNIAEVYDVVDLLENATLTSALDTFAPYETVMLDRTARAQGNALTSALRGQISGNFSQSDVMADVLASAELHANGMGGSINTSGAKSLFRQSASPMNNDREVGWRAFGEIGLIQGDAELIAGAGRFDIDGGYTLLGIEGSGDNGVFAGAALGLAQADGDAPASIGYVTSDVSTTQFSLFLGYQAAGWSLAGHVNHADIDSDGLRQLATGAMSRSQQGGSTAGGGVELTFSALSNDTISITPSASLEYTDFSFDGEVTTGGAASLYIAGRSVTSYQARFGTLFEWSIFGVEPRAYVGIVNEMGDGDEIYSASFSNAPAISFSAPGSLTLDGTWYEAAIGLEKTLSNGAVFSVTHEREINRNYLDQAVTSIALSLPF